MTNKENEQSKEKAGEKQPPPVVVSLKTLKSQVRSGGK